MLVRLSDNGASQQNSSVSLRVICSSGAEPNPLCRQGPDSGRFKISFTENELISSKCQNTPCFKGVILTKYQPALVRYLPSTKAKSIQLPVVSMHAFVRFPSCCLPGAGLCTPLVNKLMTLCKLFYLNGNVC